MLNHHGTEESAQISPLVFCTLAWNKSDAYFYSSRWMRTVHSPTDSGGFRHTQKMDCVSVTWANFGFWVRQNPLESGKDHWSPVDSTRTQSGGLHRTSTNHVTNRTFLINVTKCRGARHLPYITTQVTSARLWLKYYSHFNHHPNTGLVVVVNNDDEDGSKFFLFFIYLFDY